MRGSWGRPFPFRCNEVLLERVGVRFAILAFHQRHAGHVQQDGIEYRPIRKKGENIRVRLELSQLHEVCDGECRGIGDHKSLEFDLTRERVDHESLHRRVESGALAQLRGEHGRQE